MNFVIRLKKKEWIRYSAILYAVTLSTYGFFRVFFHISFATDIAGIILILSVIHKKGLHFSKIKSQQIIKVMIWIFCIFCGLIAVVSSYSFRLSILGFRNYVIYLLFGISLSTIDNKNDYLRTISAIERIGLIVNIFAICQFLCFNQFPTALLYFPGAKFEGVYGLYSTTLYRVNGLLENTIVFGSFSSVISLIIFAKICTYRDKTPKSEYVYLIISYLATILTFGRVAIAGCFVCTMLTFYLTGRTKKLGRGVKLIFVFSTIVILLYIFFGDSVPITRLLGKGESTITSNRIHQIMALKGIQALRDNWLVGIGMGTQGYIRGNLKAIITDGGWIAMMLEIGIPLAIEFISILIIMIVYSLSIIKRSNPRESIYINSIFVSITLFYLFSGAFNSSFPALANYGIYWIICGCMLGLNRIVEKEGCHE